MTHSETAAAPSATTVLPPEGGPEFIGVGSPLVDLVVSVDDAFLAEHVGGGKGGMELVTAETIGAIIGALSGEKGKGKNAPKVAQSAGGAASNTTVGVANLGIRAAFIGASGEDEYATFYKGALKEHGCDPRLIARADHPTGHVLSLVTPDAQRTMRTCLGAAATLDPAFFTPATFAGARVVMLEGYTLFNHALTRAVARSAKAAGCALALDFASYEVVNANREVLTELLNGQVDLVFANQDEAAAWHPGGPEAALADLARRAPLAVVKLGKDGALIARGSERAVVKADPVTAIDTTGAGDCWAAGFLAAWLKGLPLAQCGRAGALAGAAVVQVMGGQLPREKWLAIKGWMDAWA
jgi:sugar/nucleoside kinase (ribokinase family)